MGSKYCWSGGRNWNKINSPSFTRQLPYFKTKIMFSFLQFYCLSTILGIWNSTMRQWERADNKDLLGEIELSSLVRLISSSLSALSFKLNWRSENFYRLFCLKLESKESKWAELSWANKMFQILRINCIHYRTNPHYPLFNCYKEKGCV